MPGNPHGWASPVRILDSLPSTCATRAPQDPRGGTSGSSDLDGDGDLDVLYSARFAGKFSSAVEVQFCP
jgi:hypothetical protein